MPEQTACLDGAFFYGFWPFAKYVELIWTFFFFFGLQDSCPFLSMIWTLAALCLVKDELDDLVVYLAWGGTPGCGLFGLT